jgi:hypothetical protein
MEKIIVIMNIRNEDMIYAKEHLKQLLEISY